MVKITSKHTGQTYNAIQITDADFDGTRPNPRHVDGVRYCPQTRRAWDATIPNPDDPHEPTETAAVGDWLVMMFAGPEVFKAGEVQAGFDFLTETGSTMAIP